MSLGLVLVIFDGNNFSKLLRSRPEELASELHLKLREVVKIVVFCCLEQTRQSHLS